MNTHYVTEKIHKGDFMKIKKKSSRIKDTMINYVHNNIKEYLLEL